MVLCWRLRYGENLPADHRAHWDNGLLGSDLGDETSLPERQLLEAGLVEVIVAGA
jgi:hypothetical protein